MKWGKNQEMNGGDEGITQQELRIEDKGEKGTAMAGN